MNFSFLSGLKKKQPFTLPENFGTPMQQAIPQNFTGGGFGSGMGLQASAPEMQAMPTDMPIDYAQIQGLLGKASTMQGKGQFVRPGPMTRKQSFESYRAGLLDA
jgi:hypothetical protein